MYILCTWNKSLGDTVNDDKMLGDVTNVYKVRFRLCECVEAMDNGLWLCVLWQHSTRPITGSAGMHCIHCVVAAAHTLYRCTTARFKEVL